MRLIILSFFYLFVTACTSMANIDYDRSINFKSLTTYSIQSKPVRVDDDTRINTPFMQERIISAIESSLAQKGLSKTDKSASLIVKYHLEVKRSLETEDSSVAIGFGTSSHHTSLGMGFVFPVGETYSIDNLILTIDMISANTNKLVWRGSLGYGLPSGATPETYTRMANDLVAEILKEYPPK